MARGKHLNSANREDFTTVAIRVSKTEFARIRAYVEKTYPEPRPALSAVVKYIVMQKIG